MTFPFSRRRSVAPEIRRIAVIDLRPDDVVILELAEQVIEVVGSRSKLVRRPLPEDDPRQRKPDISLAKANLGWEPKIKLRQGLEKTAQFFEQELSLASATAS